MITGTPTALTKLRAWARTLLRLRPDARTVAHFFAAAVLCASDLGLGPTCASACLLSACERSRLTPCVLGAIAGNILLWGLRDAAAPCAVCAAVLCARLLVPKGKQHFAVPATGALSCAVVGLLSMVEAGFSGGSVLRWIGRIALTAGGILLFRAALIRKHYAARVGALLSLLPGLAALSLPGGWSLAAATLAWVAAASSGTVYACAGTVFMTAFYAGEAGCFAAFCLCALLYRLLRSRPVACATACGIYLLSGIWFQSYGFSACAAVGTLLALFFAPDRILPAPPRAELPKHPARAELQQAARALMQASDMLDVPEADSKRELAALLDTARGQVCRNCAKDPSCRARQPWDENELMQHAARILAKNAAKTDDLPFLDRCIHPDAFLTAVNDAMDEERNRQRFRRRLNEARRAARAQYVLMGSLLGRLSDQLYAPEATVNYRPDISVQAVGRGGSAISGDRGAAFAGPGADYYVLLCDGMGTGEAAAGESVRAVSLIRRLLLSGASPEHALRALNGVYLLRDDGCFSTVDLLRINLTSGDAILYKWGGAASYLKRSRGLRRLGGGGLPPGLDERESFEKIHLNLDSGGVVVLISDGLSGKQTRGRLEHCGSMLPRDVARSLFAGREPGADDCTAVAVRLCRARQRDPAPV